MRDVRTIFMGTPEFAGAILNELIDEGLNVVAVVAQPDKLTGRRQVLTYPYTKQIALEHDIEVIQPVKIRQDYQRILDLKPDLIVTCAYGQIIPKAILDAPELGCINVHASLLPALRGGAPIQHAIIDGYKTTGITIMEMDVGMDSGNIISQQEITISHQDTYGTLHDRLMEVAVDLLRRTMPSILEGNHASVRQDPDLVTFGYNISREEEKISFDKSYEEVYNQIRGLIPVPCSYFILDDKKVKVWEVSTSDLTSDQPDGYLSYIGNDLGVTVKGRILLLKQLQLEGKQKMAVRDIKNGAGRNWEGKTAR